MLIMTLLTMMMDRVILLVDSHIIKAWLGNSYHHCTNISNMVSAAMYWSWWGGEQDYFFKIVQGVFKTAWQPWITNSSQTIPRYLTVLVEAQIIRLDNMFAWFLGPSAMTSVSSEVRGQQVCMSVRHSCRLTHTFAGLCRQALRMDKPECHLNNKENVCCTLEWCCLREARPLSSF